MKIKIKVGDVLSEPADVLISTANPWLNLSGGVNGAIRETVGPGLQNELHEFLKHQGLSAVPAGTVVRSNAYSLPFKHILHAVAIDPFYDSSTDLVEATFAKALDMALELQALGEEFYPAEHCKRYHDHWAKLGTTSMEAAGWKKG